MNNHNSKVKFYKIFSYNPFIEENYQYPRILIFSEVEYSKNNLLLTDGRIDKNNKFFKDLSLFHKIIHLKNTIQNL